MFFSITSMRHTGMRNMLYKIMETIRREIPPHLRRRLTSDQEIQFSFGTDDDNGQRRIPKDGHTTGSHFADNDYHPDFSKLNRLGTSGWNWPDGKSVFFVIDVDDAAGHKKGQPREKIDELVRAAKEVEQVEMIRSKSGEGVHIILWCDPDHLPTALTRAEHKSNAARSLRWLASRLKLSFDLAAAVDCAGVIGSVFWVLSG
jgi:hypothetical protein